MACGCGGNCCAPFPWAAPVKAAGRTTAAPVRTQGPCPPGTRAQRLTRFGAATVLCISTSSRLAGREFRGLPPVVIGGEGKGGGV